MSPYATYFYVRNIYSITVNMTVVGLLFSFGKSIFEFYILVLTGVLILNSQCLSCYIQDADAA